MIVYALSHLSVRGGEGSLAGGGSLVTARSFAGDGEGGPERDIVGVGLSTPDTEGSATDAYNGTSSSFRWYATRRVAGSLTPDMRDTVTDH